MRKRFGRSWAKLALLVAGTLCGLALAEGLVRTLNPELQDVVDAKFEKHAYRIHANPRSSASTWMHPEIHEEHPLIHNSLSLRQHREFEVAKSNDTLRMSQS
jgi:hypothetical protein